MLKPNAEMRPGFFDGHFIARQLRYTGVAAVVEIQRSGYPISLPKADFVRRYRSCVFSEPALVDPALPIDTLCTNVLDTLQQLLGLGGSWLGELSVQLGKTKIFLREEIVREIEKAREAIWEEAASAAQRVGRGRITRKATGLLRAHGGAARVRRMDDKGRRGRGGGRPVGGTTPPSRRWRRRRSRRRSASSPSCARR